MNRHHPIRVLLVVIALILGCGSRPVLADEGFPTVPLWPLVYMKESREATTTDVLFPLFHYQRQKARTSWQVRPWLLEAENDPENDSSHLRLLLRVYNSERRGDETRRHLFPLYWQGDWQGKRWLYLLPLYGQQHNADGSNWQTVLPPLFIRHQYPARDSIRYDWLWPLGSYERRPSGGSSRFIPLWWHTRDNQHTTGFVMPVYWENDPRQNLHRDAILPLWFNQRKGDCRANLLLPLWLYNRCNNEQTSLLLPLWYEHRNPQTLTRVLPPYYHHQDLSNRHRTDIVFPLWFSRSSPESFSGFVPPYYWYRSRTNDDRTDLLLPLWYRSVAGEQHISLLVPLYYYRSTPRSYAGFVFPYYWQRSRINDNGTDLLLPLWYRRQHDEEKTALLFPLWWHYQNPQSDTKLLLPVWYSHTTPNSSAGFVPPYYWYRNRLTGDRTDFAFPLWYRQIKGDQTTNLLLPLWWQFKNPQSDTRLLLPIYFTRATPQGRSGVIFPYYWYRSRQNSDSYDGIFPLWYRQTKGENRFSLLLPLWYRNASPEQETTLLLPLWLSRRSGDNSFATLFPLHYRVDTPRSHFRLTLPLHTSWASDKRELSSFFPVYFHHRNIERDTDLHYVPPLYGRYTRGDDYRRSFYLFPLFSHWRDTKKDLSGWNLFWPLISYERTPETLETWFMPLFWAERSAKESLTMVSGLYWSHAREDRHFRLLAPLYLDYDVKGDGQTHLLPLYSSIHQKTGYRKSFILGPLWINTKDPAHARSQTDILWPLISARKDGEKQHTHVFPFYWQDKKPGSLLRIATAALLPPYYVQRRDGDRESLYLWPFFGRKTAPDYRSTSVLWPLFNREIDGERRHAHLLPLYWLDSDSDSLLRVATPALLPPYYIQWRDGDREAFHLWPFFGRRTGPNYRSTSVLWPLFNREIDGERGHAHLLPFFWQDSSPDSLLRVATPALLPPYYIQRRDGDRESLYLWPLFGRTTAPGYRSTSVLWPLFRHAVGSDNAHTHLFPFYYYDRNKDTMFRFASVALLPPYYVEEQSGLRSSLHIWPFYRQTRAPNFKSISALFSIIRRETDHDRVYTHVLPFYWEQRDKDSRKRLITAALIPPYYISIRDKSRDRLYLWPLYQRELTATTRSDAVLWPLMHYKRSFDGQSATWHFLTAYGHRQGEQSYSGVFPLWHRNVTTTGSDTATVISWWRNHDDTRQFSLLHLGDPDFSLFTSKSQVATNHQHLLPLYWYTSVAQKQARDLAIVWPFYTYRQRGEAKKHQLLWKLLYTESGPEKQETGFLWRLIHSKHDAREDIFEFNPFYYRETHADGASYSAWLGGLYATLKHAGGTRTTLLWVIRFGAPLSE